MATANFPSNPVLNQTYTNLDRSWTWNGQYWQSTSATIGYSGSVGYVGSTGYVGSKGESSFTFSSTAPSTPLVGDRWLDSITMAEVVWTNDGDSNQWVEVAGTGFLGQTGYTGSAGSGQMPWQVVSSSTTVVANNGYFVDTTVSAISLTLPASAAIGNTIRFNDLAGNFAVNNLTILRNGHKIQGVADDLAVSDTQASFGLVYSNATYGWKILEV